LKAVVQRVRKASVVVDGVTNGAIQGGMLILLGVMRGDGESEAEALAERIARFRFFADEHQRMNLSALDCDAEALVVSQFTLAADGRKGRRPSFDRAAAPESAEPLYEHFVATLRRLGITTATGVFGAHMEVALTNTGPVTFVLEQPPKHSDPAADGPR